MRVWLISRGVAAPILPTFRRDCVASSLVSTLSSVTLLEDALPVQLAHRIGHAQPFGRLGAAGSRIPLHPTSNNSCHPQSTASFTGMFDRRGNV
jgi:hypothetical protein